MPLTVNAKIDKRALPNPEGLSLSGAAEYQAPQNEIEEQLVRILAAEVDKPIEAVGVLDNFFDLGMNSIELVKILGTINREFGIDLKITMLFEYPNIQDLVENVFQKVEVSVEEDDNVSEEMEDLMDLMEE